MGEVASYFTVLMAASALCGCSPEVRLRRTFATQTTGVIHLPPGEIEVSSELRLARGAHDLEIAGSSNTQLKAARGFKGRAILVGENVQRVRLHDFSIDGNLAALQKPLAMAPPENAFRVWYPDNGILLDQSKGVDISGLRFANIAGFPILVSRSSDILIAHVDAEDSGSLNAKGRNNLSGGILIEEGSSNFRVGDSIFRRIRGNGLWTHSLLSSPRLQDGVFENNTFDMIGRDAIQVGHATRVRVEGNTGSNIGYPAEIVDIENGGIPVAIDTSGNVDATVYARNRFQEVNGKCFDLDGFHDGLISENECVDRRRAEDYPFGHFGIVMNNTDPKVESANIVISDNLIEGMKYGGLFLMGTGHRVTGNRFLNLNTAGCNESAPRTACIYKTDEPEMLESGIYLGRGIVRMQETRNNVIRGNRVTGHKMSTRCMHFGPGVFPSANIVERNECAD